VKVKIARASGLELRVGAFGFDSRCLLSALRDAVERGDLGEAKTILHQMTIDFAIEGQLPRSLTMRYGMTPSEHRVIALAVRGLTNRALARQLGVSRNTVRNRLASSFGKLSVSRRAEAASVLLLGFRAHERPDDA